MKRFLLILLTLAIAVLGGATGFAQEDYPMVISGGTVSFAEEDYPTPIGGTYFNVEDAVEIEDDGFESIFFGSPSQPFEEYIVEKCLERKASIDVSSYGMETSEFSDNYFDVILRHPELMVIPSFKPYTTDGIMTNIEPRYYFATAEEDAEARAALSAKVDEYIDYAQNAPDDLGKLLLIHDKIAYDYSYDNDYEQEKANSDYFAYHPYGFILRDKAVCQGYAGLLYAIATKLGIEADFCNADAINHIWNYIRIDGNWYHVDLTWDDPTYYADEEKTHLIKSAYHKYFMRSDEDFASGNHGELITYNRFGGDLYECSSTKFESNHLFNLANLYVINYSDGNYCIPVDSEVTFEYPTLYTGPMLVTKPYESVAPDGTTPVNQIVYTYTGEAGREYISICRRVKNGAMAFGQNFSTTDNGFHYSFVPINKDGAEYSFYFFDRTSLAPLSVKHSVIDK